MIERVLDWRNRRAWLRAIPRYASLILTPDVRKRLEHARPDCWSDVMDWLPNHEHLVPIFCEALWSYYTHVKGFHGCRPESLSSYFENGLKGQAVESIVKKFHRIYADVPSGLRQRAIEQMHQRGLSERGRTWLSGDDKKMIEQHGHYIIHGSEYLMALAARMSDGDRWGEDYRLRLRQIGIPTILEVNIPVALIPDVQKREVGKMILSEWGQIRASKPLRRSSAPCYVVRHDIPAECIKAHYHPAQIIDFHTDNGPYVNTALTCELCY